MADEKEPKVKEEKKEPPKSESEELREQLAEMRKELAEMKTAGKGKGKENEGTIKGASEDSIHALTEAIKRLEVMASGGSAGKAVKSSWLPGFLR